MRELIESGKRLNAALSGLRFSAPVDRVYRPLEYAWRPHQRYLEKYAAGAKRVLFLGMNPGPFGMVQTGVPFGEVAAVRDWLGIEEPVGKPADEHPKRPVEGFDCKRSEVSGRRLWGLFAERFGNAEAFFERPLRAQLLPARLDERDRCQSHARQASRRGNGAGGKSLPASISADVISIMRPSFLIGIGGFAEERLRRAAQTTGSDAVIGRILHPSPASPAANRGWAEAASRQLAELGVW